MKSIEILGRVITNAYYDFQLVRIASMNRVRDIIRKRAEGIEFNEVEEKKEKKSYVRKYTDKQLLAMLAKLLGSGEMSIEEHDYIMKCWGIMEDSHRLEKKHQDIMKDYVESEQVYHEFLNKIRGIAEVLSANIIKSFGGDCSKYDTVSKLWAHSGNSVIDGKAPKRKKGENLTYSPQLRTMTWKISDSLMKQNKGVYRNIYNIDKEKQLNREYKAGELFEVYGKPYKETDTKLSKGHAHNRALRKMRKLFLSHYWVAARELAGLPHKKTYVEGILNHTNIISWREAIEKEGMLIKEKPDKL